MNYFVLSLVKAAVVAGALLTTLAYLQWVERKVLAHIQARLGPWRVGPHGLLQPLADVIKLLTKEDLLPPHVNKPLFLAAPFIAVTTALLTVAVIPLGPEVRVGGVVTPMQLADLNIGVLFVLAVSSLGVYGIVLAGWASNNKYSLLGGLRSSAQVISYELPLAFAIVAPLLLANTLSLRGIVENQGGYLLGVLPNWHIFQGPWPQLLSLAIFVVAGFAEVNRIPFDLPEAENELVAGYHTEYSSMKFAAFFMAEYANILTLCLMTTVLFLGGWHAPWPSRLGSDYAPALLFGLAGAAALHYGLRARRRRDRKTLPAVAVVWFAAAAVFLLPAARAYLLPLFWFGLKTALVMFFVIWVRGTLPRFRYDQLMSFAWKGLFPLALANLFLTGLLVALS